MSKYRKWSTLSKIGFWGGIASILGIPLAIVLFLVSRPSPQPQTKIAPEPKKEFTSVQESPGVLPISPEQLHRQLTNKDLTNLQIQKYKSENNGQPGTLDGNCCKRDTNVRSNRS